MQTKNGTVIATDVNGELGPRPNIFSIARIADGTERTLEYCVAVSFGVTAKDAIDRARVMHADLRNQRLYAVPVWSGIGKALIEAQGMSVTECIARHALLETVLTAERFKRRRRRRKASAAQAARFPVAGPKAPKQTAAPVEPEAVEPEADEAISEPAPRKRRTKAASVQAEAEPTEAEAEAPVAAEPANPRAAQTIAKIKADKTMRGRMQAARKAVEASAATAKARELLTAEGEPAAEAPAPKRRRKA